MASMQHGKQPFSSKKCSGSLSGTVRNEPAGLADSLAD